jgi:RNA polymerase sigma-70 factor (ECF subfamily)
MNVSPDSALLTAARRLDRDALAAIYDQMSPGIYRYAMRLLGDETRAEECVAETFNRFLQALHNGGGPNDHVQAYLYRIAHNWITDSYRRQVPDLPIEEDYPAGQDVPSQADRQIEQKQVRNALACLTPEQRQAVVLKYLEGWENEAVACAMQKPVGAVKALQHRGVEALRRLLTPMEAIKHDVQE